MTTTALIVPTAPRAGPGTLSLSECVWAVLLLSIIHMGIVKSTRPVWWLLPIHIVVQSIVRAVLGTPSAFYNLECSVTTILFGSWVTFAVPCWESHIRRLLNMRPLGTAATLAGTTTPASAILSSLSSIVAVEGFCERLCDEAVASMMRQGVIVLWAPESAAAGEAMCTEFRQALANFEVTVAEVADIANTVKLSLPVPTTTPAFPFMPAAYLDLVNALSQVYVAGKEVEAAVKSSLATPNNTAGSPDSPTLATPSTPHQCTCGCQPSPASLIYIKAITNATKKLSVAWRQLRGARNAYVDYLLNLHAAPAAAAVAAAPATVPTATPAPVSAAPPVVVAPHATASATTLAATPTAALPTPPTPNQPTTSSTTSAV